MVDPFAWLAGWIQQEWLVPALWRLGWMDWEDVSFMWALFAIYGVLQVVVNLAICWPAERFWPLRRTLDRGHVGMDVVYTLIARIGVFPLVTFFGFYSAQVWLNGWMTDHGYVPPTLETLFPWLMGQPVVAFLVYAVVLDFADYWRHRFSHTFGWWYGLHALHHAQRDMTFWSDDRNHVLDDVISYVWFIAVGLLIGVPPMQFPVLVLVLRLVESLSHANTRLHFGWLGERLLVSPRFHRTHHGLRAAGRNSVNFGGVLPWWDMLFRTHDFADDVVETGDPKAGARLEGGSWIAQQTEGLRLSWRLATRRLRARA
ncbi:sterol desaturase/sphingolipid hydroxylase (fatty acid hydroxylase superfamily) [Endobacter medicaginis]|uniref:Sterol desaturase family protein n=1 Tax=Endobacter medicaginis TaxID=1181271 RepID=A0A850NYA2_9PROT|nr:sterol desaturase family protein [Endobacter medicaginis]MBB3172513.1 sterol desaturase/sphingolipid hydroxylase (fatty acid hydroxylase superfamily) [Endobacter medicaginis]MCX5473999.1 sterol desaturase family protein [Endobacter medicaginis]NVN30877.1 sterol desaturase family protein [Endobacter medicaginis]